MITNPYKSKFIVFEGIDGSGKSEQYSRLQALFSSSYPKLKVNYPKEPDSNRPIGKTVYEILKGKNKSYRLDKMKPFHFQSFYIEDRIFNYRENIIPSLRHGVHVIQDRGVASSICYGSKKVDEFYDFMGLHDRVFSAAKVPFIWPDLILIFDISADLSVKRMLAGGKKLDKFETKSKLSLVRKNYQSFAKMYSSCVIIDGRPSPEEVFLKTKNQIMSVLV